MLRKFIENLMQDKRLRVPKGNLPAGEVHAG
jgi:hypothetical protein